MTHRARGNFLAFKEASPWLQRAPGPREYPPSKRQSQQSKALPSALLPARDAAASPSEIFASQPNSVSKQSFGNTFRDSSCLLVARRKATLPPSSFQHPEMAAPLSLGVAGGELVLLHTDISGTLSRAAQPWASIAAQQKSLMEISMPQSWAQAPKRGGQTKHEWQSPSNKNVTGLPIRKLVLFVPTVILESLEKMSKITILQTCSPAT